MTYKERQKILKQKAKDFKRRIGSNKIRMTSPFGVEMGIFQSDYDYIGTFNGVDIHVTDTSSLFFAQLLSDGSNDDVCYIREVTN